MRLADVSSTSSINSVTMTDEEFEIFWQQYRSLSPEEQAAVHEQLDENRAAGEAMAEMLLDSLFTDSEQTDIPL